MNTTELEAIVRDLTAARCDDPWRRAREWADANPSPPPCPRCGKPCHRIAVPIEPGDDSWAWGHDCGPW